MFDFAFATARENLGRLVFLSLQCRFNFAQRQAIHQLWLGQPAFAREADAEPKILQSLVPMRVRIDYALHTFLFRQWPPPPIEIEPLRRGVELDPRAICGGRFNYGC